MAVTASLISHFLHYDTLFATFKKGSRTDQATLVLSVVSTLGGAARSGEETTVPTTSSSNRSSLLQHDDYRLKRVGAQHLSCFHNHLLHHNGLGAYAP